MAIRKKCEQIGWLANGLESFQRKALILPLHISKKEIVHIFTGSVSQTQSLEAFNTVYKCLKSNAARLGDKGVNSC